MQSYTVVTIPLVQPGALMDYFLSLVSPLQAAVVIQEIGDIACGGGGCFSGSSFIGDCNSG